MLLFFAMLFCMCSSEAIVMHSTRMSFRSYTSTQKIGVGKMFFNLK